ncbi:MAG: DUF2059 domain-containing protein [Betaproteobacteria bacterium]|nr:MAG: DUF2059 domain-containing protein [Betaproteobacteria bacterium]
MKRINLLLGAILALSLSALSQAQVPNDAKQLAQEVVELTVSDSLVQGMRQSMQPMMAQIQKQFGNEKLNAKQQEIMQRFAAETMDYVMGPEYMGKVRVAMIDAFAEVYSVEELRGIRDFYRSPAGVAMIKKTPQAMSKAMPVMQSLMEPMMTQMKERSDRLAKEISAAK